MTSPQAGNVVQQYSCRCHNITISAYDIVSTASASKPDTDYHRVFVGEDGIHINHHYLTLRTRDRAQELQASQTKLLQHLTLYCLACKAPAYRVSQEISRGYEAREGPIVPTEDWVEKETLLSKSGWIEVFVGPGGCLVGKDAIEEHFRSLELSHTFSIGVLSSSDTPRPPIESSPTSQPWMGSSTDDSTRLFHPDTQLLPSLPPLFPPPPFTPSHPVFLSLAAFATAKSTDLRQRAEEETRSLAEAKLDALEKEEADLRKEVEGIWRAYREGWKEVLGRVNEEHRRSLPPKPDPSTLISSAKSGVPMSIRDFSPIIQSHTQVDKPRHTPMSPSTSLLSASLIQTGTHLPTPIRSPGPENILSTSVSQHPNSGARSVSTVPSSQANGTRYSASPSSSPQPRDDLQYPGAFKRNMDTSVDIASSMAWTQGEEEMRRRFGGGEDSQPRDRARKRTSKNLGIGAVEAKSGPNQKTDLAPKGKTDISSPSNQAEAAQMASSSVSRAKRRVTFDVQPDVTVVNKAATKQRSEPDAEVELFDLDDLPWSEQNQDSDTLRSSRPAQPQPVVRTSSYKLRPNGGASASQPSSLPVSRAILPRSPPNGHTNWIGGSTRRFVGLAEALPLLSSSVPAGDRVLTRRPLETSTHEQQLALASESSSPAMDGTIDSQTHVVPSTEAQRHSPAAPSSNREYAEAELKHLLAASAPSHRHAWKEGGKAWEMFYQRARDKNKRVKGTIVEEGNGGNSSSLDDDDDSEVSSSESLAHGTWHNPSQYASSLPVQIRPLAQYQPPLPPLEPKTSLTDKHGVLVPPLHATNSRLHSTTAIRRAMYAERDRTRSIDPGPALDFNEPEEIEDEDTLEDINDGERGRHHALSILQARSVIPEAGMWRSMTS